MNDKEMAEFLRCIHTVRHSKIGTGISEASKKVPIFLHDVRGGKQVSSYLGRQTNKGCSTVAGRPWVPDRQLWVPIGLRVCVWIPVFLEATVYPRQTVPVTILDPGNL
jgi:hypothetical protein